MEKVFIQNNIHLGDAISILIITENLAKTKGCVIGVRGPISVKQLFNIFDYPSLKYLGPNHSNKLALNGCGLPEIPQPREVFWKLKKYKFIINDKIDHIDLPVCKLTRRESGIVHFQLDSRSTFPKEQLEDKNIELIRSRRYMGKIDLSQKEKKQMLNKFARNDQLIGIGGLDTKPYLQNYEFKLGSLPQIARWVCDAKRFIGSDSGIAHLAGAMNIPADIAILHIAEPHIGDMIVLYEFLYKTVKCHTREQLFSNKMVL